MRNFKARAVRLAGPLGGYRACRFLTRSTPKILMYHRFSRREQPGFVHHEAFERQVAYLKNHFNLITIGDLIAAYQESGCFPGNSVVITVDDGYRDFYDIAYPILKKHDATATFYVTTRFVEGDFWLWPDSIKYILEHSDNIDLNGLLDGEGFQEKRLTKSSRQHLWERMVNHLLAIDEEEKKKWLDAFFLKQDIPLPVEPAEEYRAVNWQQLKDMAANNIEVGAHTQNHPSLGRLKEGEIVREVIGSVDIIEKAMGCKPVSFCFPNGQPSDYTETVKKYVKDAGCLSAVTAFYDKYIVDDLFEIRRFNASDDWQSFIKSANGVEALAARLVGSNNIMQACS